MRCTILPPCAPPKTPDLVLLGLIISNTNSHLCKWFPDTWTVEPVYLLTMADLYVKITKPCIRWRRNKFKSWPLSCLYNLSSCKWRKEWLFIRAHYLKSDIKIKSIFSTNPFVQLWSFTFLFCLRVWQNELGPSWTTLYMSSDVQRHVPGVVPIMFQGLCQALCLLKSQINRPASRLVWAVYEGGLRHLKIQWSHFKFTKQTVFVQ